MKFPVKFVIALGAVVIGIIGMVVCIVPHYSAPEKIVAEYVSAVNAGNVDKMKKCTMVSDVSDALDDFGLGEVGDLINDLEDSIEDSQTSSQPVSNKKMSALEQSFISVPADATDITSVKLLGCAKGEPQKQLGAIGCDVTTLIQIEYVDSEGNKQTQIVEEEVLTVNSGRGYKIS